jgi:hypothetical protein
MAGDEHYPASPRSRKTPLSMRHDEVDMLVGSVSPEESPSVSSGSPEQLPCFCPHDEGAPSVGAPPFLVVARLSQRAGPNRPWAEPCTGPS